MPYFESTTQYDEKFDVLGVSKDRTSCSMFSLATAHSFLENRDLSNKEHEKNVDIGVINAKLKNVSFLSFQELLGFQKEYKETNVSYTTVEQLSNALSKQGDYRDVYDDIFFDDTNEPFAAIFLKNSFFFVVVVDPVKSVYAVRDCHRPLQYIFDCPAGLMKHLDEAYSFTKPIKQNDVLVPEFSVLAYLVMDKKFELDLNLDLGLEEYVNIMLIEDSFQIPELTVGTVEKIQVPEKPKESEKDKDNNLGKVFTFDNTRNRKYVEFA